MVFSIAVENESSSGVTLYVKDGEDETVALNMLSKEKITVDNVTSLVKAIRKSDSFVISDIFFMTMFGKRFIVLRDKDFKKL